MGVSIQQSNNIDLGKAGGDLGKADTLRYNVLTFVVEENYDSAIRELREFYNSDSEYPKLKERIERYVQHGIDLVNAIRAKRNFPGMKMLTVAKQQEMNEKFVAHFNELQQVLKRIERIQNDLRLEDIRSTVWIVKAAIYSAIAMALIAFILDANQWLLRTTVIVVDDIFRDLTIWLFGR